MEQKNQQATQSTAVVVTQQEKYITEDVYNRFSDLSKRGELRLPGNYSIENALKSAYLMLQEVVDKEGKPALQVCTKNSVTNALLDMAIQGLNPSKKQCYFVVFGNKLQLMRSYMGTIAVAKRIANIGIPRANCIYDGDEFEYEIDLNTGLKRLTKHKQSFKNIDISKIQGAYCLIPIPDQDPFFEVMNIDQIRKAWLQGAAKGQSKAHTNFTDQMCMKTVISRACKLLINSSDDSDLLVETFNSADDNLEDKNNISNVEYEVSEEIKENANSHEIDIEPDPNNETATPPETPQKIKKNNPASAQTRMEGPGF